MTDDTAPEPSLRQRSGKILALLTLSIAVPLSFAFALLVVGAMTWEGHATAHSHHELKDVGFGYPYKWIRQDQTQSTPPSYPVTVTLYNPMNTSTNMRPGLLFADIAAFAGVGVAACLAIAGGFAMLARSPRRTGPATA